MKKYIVSRMRYYCNRSVEKCHPIVKRTIDFYDLTMVLSGSATYVAEGKTYVLKENDAIFLKPGTECLRFAGSEPTKYVSFNFYVDGDDAPNLPPYLPGCVSAEIKKIISAFPHSTLSPYYHAAEKLANIVNYILLELTDTESPKSGNEHVLKILRYIEENLTEKLSLKIISREVNLSREYISSIFKKETGKTLTDYINERKILFAKDLILNGGMSLSQVSSYLGYTDYTYFSRLFKKYFATTPTGLKRKR